MPRGTYPFSASAEVRRLVKEAGKDGISFDAIWAWFHKTWPEFVVKTKIYATVQQEATKGNISRGLEKATFVANEFAPDEKNLPIRNNLKPVEEIKSPNKRTKQVAQRTKEISKQNVMDYLTDQLGPSSPKPSDVACYVVLVLGDKSGEAIINMYLTKYRKEPTHWYVYNSPMEPFYTHVGLWSE